MEFGLTSSLKLEFMFADVSQCTSSLGVWLGVNEVNILISVNSQQTKIKEIIICQFVNTRGKLTERDFTSSTVYHFTAYTQYSRDLMESALYIILLTTTTTY